MTVDVRTHQTIFDNRITVVYTVVRESGSYSHYSVSEVLPLTEVRAEYAPSNGASIRVTQRFEFPVSSSSPPPFVPKVGDYFVADGSTWYVADVTPPEFSACWVITGTRVYVDTDLAKDINWYRMLRTVSASGDQIQTPYVYQASMKGALQPTDSYTQDTLGKRGIANRFMLYLDSDLEPEHGDVFREVDGSVNYKVISWRGRQHFAELLSVELEVTI